MDKASMSLDEIIASQKKTIGGGAGRKFGRGGSGRPGRGPARVPGGGVNRRNFSNGRAPYNRATGDIDGRWEHDMYEGGRKRPNAFAAFGGGGGGSAKLIVSNLDFGVSDSDITELFSEFGQLKSAAIHYDRSGRSLGVADIIYERRADAVSAMKQYNGVPLDGRQMAIKLEGDTGGYQNLRNSGRIQPRSQRPSFNRGASSGRRGGVGRGRGTGAGRGGRGGARRSNVTAEDLDAELDAWKQTQ